VFKFITDKPLWVNILTGFGLAALVIVLFFGSLDWLTNHNATEKVPTVKGLNITAATKNLVSRGFDVDIVDSVFIDSLPPLAVIKQAPDGEAMVKPGRTIYLTINRAVPPMVDMPNLVGFSIKSAIMYLESQGLKMGDTSYKEYFAKNAVMEQNFNGKPIKPGTKIPMASRIDLVIGSGAGSTEMDVPDFYGQTLAAAKANLTQYGLGLGAIIADGNITDTLNAFVIAQTPEPYTEPNHGQRIIHKIKSGQLVDFKISATAPPAKTPAAPAPTTN
jgi:eukaryotic-like serine/threonine-protein kinase